ncbi:MAG TPA: SDR family NAD(P)-dependent oxidoreductase [Terriglobales bacterium]
MLPMILESNVQRILSDKLRTEGRVAGEIMKDKVVLVTGANGGPGTTVTQAFLDGGAKVVGTSREIRQSEFPSPDFTALSADIAGPQGANLLIDQVIKKFGRLDVLAHTVGGFAGGQSIADTDDKTFQQMFEMNLNATFYLLRAAIPELRKTGNGRIIAIGSRAALEPGAGVGAYSASKAAMVSIIRTVAAENHDAGMTANVILPGTMDTPANRKAMSGADFSKWVKPATVASLMVWLAGAAGTDVNGAVIPVYGES